MKTIYIKPKNRRYKTKTRVLGFRRVVYKKGKKLVVKEPQEINQLASKLESQLKPYSQRIALAGSIRRKKEPNDIDIVLIPKHNKKDDIKRLIERKGKINAAGDKQILSKIDGVTTDVFFADKDDWGAQLLTRTGSASHNIGLRQVAQNKGLKLNQYGLFKGNKKIAGKTEQDIYKALDRPVFKKPGRRN